MQPIKLFALYLFIAVLAIACRSTTPAPPIQSQSIVLSLGESAQIPGSDIELTFFEMLGDSRCPQDVVCIWAGRVQVLLRVAEGDASRDLALTLGEHLSDDSDTAVIGSLAVQLVSVVPYPHSERPIDPQGYQITLTWENRQ